MRKKSLPCLLLLILIVLVSGCSKNEISSSESTDSTEITTQTATKVTEVVTEPTVVNTTSVIESTAIPQETTVYLEPTTAYIAETTQTKYEETECLSYDKYVGLWEYSVGEDGIGGLVRLGIFSIDGNNAVISFSKVSANYTHITGVFNSSVPVTNGNKLKLSFTDTFGNKCSGYVELNDDSVYVKIDIDEASQPFIFGANVDVTLYKKSNEVSKNDFI